MTTSERGEIENVVRIRICDWVEVLSQGMRLFESVSALKLKVPTI